MQRGTIGKGQIIALAAIVLLAILVSALALRNRQPPLLPTDDDHRVFVDAATCMACHGPNDGPPRGANHPIGDDCTRCHGWR